MRIRRSDQRPSPLGRSPDSAIRHVHFLKTRRWRSLLNPSLPSPAGRPALPPPSPSLPPPCSRSGAPPSPPAMATIQNRPFSKDYRSVATPLSRHPTSSDPRLPAASLTSPSSPGPSSSSPSAPMSICVGSVGGLLRMQTAWVRSRPVNLDSASFLSPVSFSHNLTSPRLPSLYQGRSWAK